MCSGYGDSAPVRVMLHEQRLKDSHEFQERESAFPRTASGVTYTPTSTNTSLTFAGDYEMWPLVHSLNLWYVCVGFGSLFVSRGIPSLPLSLLHAVLRFHWRGSAEGSLMRLFDGGVALCSVKQCILHVRCATDTHAIHIYKIRSVGCAEMERFGGWST